MNKTLQKLVQIRRASDLVAGEAKESATTFRKKLRVLKTAENAIFIKLDDPTQELMETEVQLSPEIEKLIQNPMQ